MTASSAPRHRAEGNRMKQIRLIKTTLAIALFVVAGAARADVEKFMSNCDGKLCPYFQLALTPPDGWVVEQEATNKNRVQILVPKGKNFGNAPALIYVQVFFHRDKQQSLVNFAEVSNDRWRANVKGAKISALPEVKRANGKPGFLRFGAFGTDGDKDGNEFILDVVMTGLNKAAVDAAEKDYVAFLKAH
jgi:hypothetical protein